MGEKGRYENGWYTYEGRRDATLAKRRQALTTILDTAILASTSISIFAECTTGLLMV